MPSHSRQGSHATRLGSWPHGTPPSRPPESDFPWVLRVLPVTASALVLRDSGVLCGPAAKRARPWSRFCTHRHVLPCGHSPARRTASLSSTPAAAPRERRSTRSSLATSRPGLPSSLGEHPVAAHVEEEFPAYLRCGILAFGFARARCGTCGHDFLVAFSCKGRGVCPSCNGRRMAQTAAHLVDHVVPPVPVRQWVISVPKRLRWHLGARPEAVSALTKFFIDEVERLVNAAAGVEVARSKKRTDSPRIGGISFLHRFGSALNHHVHLHACITDGVFCRTATGDQADSRVRFIAARPITSDDLTALTERVRRRLIRWYKRRGFLDAEAASDLLSWNPSGFSIDASVRISLDDRDVPSFSKSLEHLVRYCARPAFAVERLAVIEGRDGKPDRVCYTLPRHKRGQWIGPGRTQKSTAPDEQGVVTMSPTDLLDRLADLVPPPR